MKSFKQFLRTTRNIFKIYLKIAPGLTISILITQVLLGLFTLINVYFFGRAIDTFVALVANKTFSPLSLLPVIALLVSIELLSYFVAVLHSYLQAILSTMDVNRIRLMEVDHVVSLGISQLEDSELTNKTTRFNEVYTSMFQQLSLLIDLFSMAISIISYGIVVFTFAPFIAVLFILLFVVKYLTNSRFTKKIWTLRRETTEENRIAWNAIYSLGDPASLKEILLSDGVSFLRNKFESFTLFFYDAYKKIRSRWFIFEIIQSFGGVVLYGVGIYFLLFKSVTAGISIGTITFYLRSLGSFSDQLDTISYRLSRAIESGIRLQDALELFELYKPQQDGNQVLEDTDVPPEIKLDRVSFTYQNGKHPVIKSLNLSIKPGEKIAIVGENGAGKTTLVKILTRIYEPQEGNVLVNDMNIKDLKVQSWYRKLGVLFQDFNTYGSLTARENVLIGKPNHKPTITTLNDALEKADALDFVSKYPKGLNQLLSERYKGGIRPSGGQWQKIAIARFFYRNAPVLILDEPTASIDAVSEAQIFDNIYKFMKGKTVIIISHRFSTVRNADRIIVLDKGKIIEDGSHEELLAKNGKYAKSFKLQAKGYS